MPVTSDTQFERTFSDLAYSVLSDKAPALLDHLVGFQVLDVNDDQTKAVGVFGCKIDEEWLYVPVFFMNGELRGQELAYLKNQDSFIPMKENWIQFIMNRTPHTLGQATDLEKNEVFTNTTDLLPFQGSPSNSTKLASFEDTDSPDSGLSKVANNKLINIPIWGHRNKQAWSEPVEAALAKLPTGGRYEKAAQNLDVVNFLKSTGPKCTRSFLELMSKNAGLTNSLLQYYDIQDFNIKFASPVDVKLKPVQIVSYSEKDKWKSQFLNDQDKEKLLKGEVIVKDNRTNTSKVYNLTTPQRAEAPNTTGVYEVLGKDGDLTKCLVIVSPLSVSKYGYPTSCSFDYSSNRNKKLAIINLEGNGAISNISAEEVFARELPIGGMAFNTDYEKFPSISTIKEGKTYAIITQGSGTEPFHVLKKTKAADGTTHLYVVNSLYPSKWDLESPEDSGSLIVIKDKGHRLDRIVDTLYAPALAKVVEVKTEAVEYDSEGYTKYRPRNGGMADPGNPAQVEQYLFRGQTAVPLKLCTNGTDYSITLGSNDYAVKTAGFIGHRAALDQLIYQHGINGNTALGMLKSARTEGAFNRAVKFAVKYPEGYPNFSKEASPVLSQLLQGGTGAPLPGNFPTSVDPSLGIPVQPGFSQDTNIPGLSGYGNESAYDGQQNQSIQSLIEQASSTGQKEVFDTAVVSGLVEAMDVESLIDKYLGDIILGMDRVGRIYFLFLQHNEDFKERYGQEDMIKLEDSLKNTFDSLGDLAMFLKQKTVEKSVSIDKTEVNL